MYDLAIIGAGWAGYNAAVKAKSLGLKVALIEKSQVGGTCLNQGCIPTKSLIHSAKIYNLTQKSKTFGINIPVFPVIDFSAVCARKEKIVQQLRRGMEFMLKGVDLIHSEARIASDDTIELPDKKINTKHILIATGSAPIELKDLKFDTKKIVSSNEILNLLEIPSSILIVGGGVIGCEFASLFSNLGTKVTIVELSGQLLPGEDKDIAKKLENIYLKKSIKINLNTDASGLNIADYDLALVCVGRKPRLDGLGLEKLGLKIEKGKICVDEYLRTSIPNIYAAGDCTGKIMLAHYAAYQGKIAAENIAHPENNKKADNINIPNCIFTDPEIASIGLNEQQIAGRDVEININKFDFLSSGMARIIDETDGFVKTITYKKTEQLLGASIIGPKATELISVFALALQSGLKSSDLKNIILPHPTISECFSESFK